jgi:hypothetical protein
MDIVLIPRRVEGKFSVGSEIRDFSERATIFFFKREETQTEVKRTKQHKILYSYFTLTCRSLSNKHMTRQHKMFIQKQTSTIQN